MLLESQYSQFKEGLNVTKPKGGVSFITDFDRRDILAITHQQNQPADDKQKGLGKPAALAPAQAANKTNEIIENSDLPKF